MTETNVGAPTTIGRPILDDQKFQTAVTKIQDFTKEKYGYSMPYDQARGIAQGDPQASKKIRLEMPTLAFKDQAHRQAVDTAGLTGIWEPPGGGMAVQTMASRELDMQEEALGLEGQRTAATVSGVTGRTREKFTAADFGVLDIDRYQDPETGQITDYNVFEEAKGVIAELATELGIRLSNEQIISLARGNEIEVLSSTVAGRGVAVSEQEQTFEEWRFSQSLKHDITMEELRQEGRREMYHGWYDPNGNWVMGTGDLDLHRIDVQEQLQRDGMAEEDARFYANLEVDRQRLFGHFALRKDEFGNPVDMNGDGRPDVDWIEGQLGLQARELIVREDLANLDAETRTALTQMGIDSDELLAEMRLNWERDQLEGYNYYDAEGMRRRVYGAQEWELIGDAQRRQGFSAVVSQGVDSNGQTIWRSVHFSGTEEHQRIMQTEAVKLPWTLAEKKRKGYFSVMLDAHGNPLLDDKGQTRYEWVHGTDYTERDLQKLSQDHEIELQDLRFELMEDQEHRNYLYNLVYRESDLDEAARDRAWKSMEREQDRQFEEDILDKKLTYEDRKWRRELRAAREELFWNGVGALGGEILTRVLDRTTGDDSDYSVDDLLNDVGAGVSAAVLANRLGITEQQAAQLKERLGPAAAIDPNDTPPGTDAGSLTVEPTGARTDAGLEIGEGSDGKTYVRGDDGRWRAESANENTVGVDGGTGITAPDGTDLSIGDTRTLSDGTDITISEAGNGDVVGTSSDGSTYVQSQDGTWQQAEMNPTNGRFTAIGDTPALTDATDAGAVDWGRLRKTVTMRNVVSAALGAYAGWQGGGYDYSQFSREHPELAGFMELGKLGVTATQNPVAAGAYVVGRTARGMYDQHSGARTEYWNSLGHTMTTANTARWMPATDEKGKRVAEQGNWKAFVDYESGEVTYSQGGGGTFSESLETFIERNGFVPMSLGDEGASLVEELPREIREELKFIPAYVYLWKDGGVTFVNDKANSEYDAHYLSPERAREVFQLTPDGEIGTGEPEGTDDYGVPNETALRTTAIDVSPLTENEVDAVSNTISDPRKRERWLKMMGERREWTQADISYVFEEDPETPGSYMNHGGWSIFQEYTDNGKILIDDEVGA